MSSKLAALTTLLLVALLALAQATTYTTITTTTVDEEATANMHRGRCDERQMMKMSHCTMYLACKKGESSESLRMVVNPRGGEQQCEEKHMEQCCNQLGNMKEECRCQAIDMMLKQMEQAAGPEQMRGVRQIAQDLPNRCNMSPTPRQCQMRAVWF